MLEGAKTHIANLEKSVEAFLREDNRTAIENKDPKTGDHIVQIQFGTDLPRIMALHVHDAFSNLRTALDQAVYASSVSIYGGDPKQTKFPFADDAKGVADNAKGRCKDVHPDVVALMLAMEPYEGGNRTLWSLNKTRNQEIHKFVLPASVGNTGISISSGFFKSVQMAPMSEWSATSRRLSWLRIGAGLEGQFTVYPQAQISLNPALGFGSKPAVAVLNECARMVESIVMAIEAETARIISERSQCRPVGI